MYHFGQVSSEVDTTNYDVMLNNELRKVRSVFGGTMQKPGCLAASGFSKPTENRSFSMSEHIVPRPELTAEYLRSILNYDQETGIFTWKVSTSRRVKAGDVAGSLGGAGYLNIKLQSRLHLAHRLAWLYMHSNWPTGQIDHINRIRTDNRIVNLRDVSNKQNHQNRSKSSTNTSGHTGVYWNKQRSKWVARIKHNQKQIHLGYFTTLEEALSARKAAEKLYWADTYTN